MRSVIVALLASSALAACSGSESSGGGDVKAADATPASFTGDWKVSGHIVTPWFAGEGFAPEADAEILEKALTLSETASSGPAALTCAAATTAMEIAPVVGLFDGKVTDAAMAASVLGVEGESVAVLKQTCTANGDAVQVYHLVKQDRLLLAHGDVVYQFDRPGVELPASEKPAATPAAPAAATPAADPAAPATPH